MDLVVNEVIDKEVDKAMTKVVVEVNKNLVKEVNEGLVVVCRKSLKVHILMKGLLHVNLFLEKVLTNTDVVQKFSNVGRV